MFASAPVFSKLHLPLSITGIPILLKTMPTASESIYYLTLLRHGESEGNATDIIQGQLDYPLTPKGIQQARTLAARWQSIQASFDGPFFESVIASPLTRARQTAEIVAGALNLTVELDPIWIERGFGSLDGWSITDILKLTPPVDFHHPYEPPGEGGESSVDLFLRASQALNSVLKRPAGRYLIVSHGAILNMVVYAILGITPHGHYNSPRFRFGNTAYANFTYDAATRRWHLLSFDNPEDPMHIFS
jgi:2,3-bisphosphoglycerate-dependent phosphoglycerate mutase